METAGKVLEIPARVADAAGERVTDATGSPALGTATNVGIQSIPALLLKGRSTARPSQTAVADATNRRLVEAGGTIPPSELVSSAPAKTILRAVESIGGKEAMQQTFSAKNVRNFGDRIRKDIGIPGKGQITPDDIAAAKEPHFEVYREAGDLSPAAAAAKEKWQDANFEAKLQSDYHHASKSPKAFRKAEAARAEAEAQMAIIEQEAMRAGKPELVEKLRKARVELGKIGTVEKALNEATGEVAASVLKAAKDRKVPLKGGMEEMATMSQAFRNKLTQPSVVQPGVSKIDAVAAMLAAALKGNLKAIAAITGAPYATRAVLGSRPVQRAALPSNKPAPTLTATDQMRRAAIVAALQQQGN